ncbi:MAG: dihydroorotate dehydrogenase [Acidobacteriia bacterium]|nr:dihydroorotate dehydrogenase [Terriglobia bacterium]
MANLQTEIAGTVFKNPVFTASGTFGYGVEFASLFDLNRLGGIVVKGLSAKPIAGNPAPRLVPARSGMLNSVGLQNIGAPRFIQEKLPYLRTLHTPIIANVFGYTLHEYLECLRILNDSEGIAAYELNISCPNTSRGGMEFSSDPQLTHEVVAAAKGISRRPLWVKLSPNCADVTVIARAAAEAGADALTLINTVLGLSLDVDTTRPRLPRGLAGLSGPAIKPIALRWVYQTAGTVQIPIVGVGGIASTEDAIEFLLAGARAIQVGTANFYDPMAALKIVRGLETYCLRHHITSVQELVGKAAPPSTVPAFQEES